ncbi:MAG: SDR family oxidoreductase [Planctomycetaceae bacterium]|nr:SDR family oxidoreductase [Planctomycetaceae bacterium]
MELQDRVAIVTGGAVRIGRDLSLRLAAVGMRVCLHYGSSEQEAEQTADEIRSAGRQVVTVQADLGTPVEAATTIIEAALSEFGKVDVLVNNASIFHSGSLSKLSLEDWTRHQRINLEAPLFLSQRFAEQIDDGQIGAIVNIVDWRALRPQPGHLSYTLSKAGLVCLTQILAQELAPRVRVNAIAPGAILPPPDADAGHLEQVAKAIPLQRTGSPANIAEAVLFLLQNDFVTGEVLHVTGGQQLRVPQ